MYEALRTAALDAVRLGLPAPPPEHSDVSGVVVDIPADGGGFATLIAMSEGTTSLYLSTGGGVIGAGQHPSVGAANRELRQTAQATLPSLSESSARARIHRPASPASSF